MTEIPGMSLNCRYPNGIVSLRDIDSTMTIDQFQQLLFEKTLIAPHSQILKTGYPPLIVQLPEDRSGTEIATLLVDGESFVLDEKRDETVVVDNPMKGLSQEALHTSGEATDCSGSFPTLPSSLGESSATARSQEFYTGDQNGYMDSYNDSDDEDLQRALALSLVEAGPAHANGDEFEPEPIWRQETENGKYIVRRYVDSDNSCLFTAVAYVMEGNRLKGWDLRGVIAATVRSDPFQYNEAVLGRPNEEYCEWIMNPQHWGGEIELLILSQYYQKQIAAYDIQTTKCYTYGADAGFEERVLLVYDGIHYDAMALSPFKDAPESEDSTIFRPYSVEGNVILESAQTLVQKLNETHQFTDLSQFQLRCDECGRGFTGHPQAQDHGRATGHTKFSEYR